MKLLLALSIGIGLTSAYFGQQWVESNQALKSTVQKMTSQLREAQAAGDDLATALTPDKAPMTIDEAMSAVMLSVFNNRIPFEVSLAYTTPAKLTTGGSVSRLDALVEDIPGTALQSVRINLSGTYQNYEGLLGYLESLKSLPVAIVRLKVQDQTFDVALRVYGNKV